MLNDNAFGNSMTPKLTTLSTGLNIGSSESENLSAESQSSDYSSGMVVGNQGCNPANAGVGSFQLFGKVIHMNQHVGSGFDDVGHMEDDGNKEYETDGLNNGQDLS
uniref:Uncharacterized protein n=1 Tax=Rhizophora mucronata TaxID=61149 RepID=A0A2P2MXQ1_RHIMU